MSSGETKKLRNQEVVAIYEQIAKWLKGQEVMVLESHTIAITYRQPNKPVFIVYDFKRSLRPLARVVERGELALLAPFYEERELMDRLKELFLAITAQQQGDRILGDNVSVKLQITGDVVANGNVLGNNHTWSGVKPSPGYLG